MENGNNVVILTESKIREILSKDFGIEVNSNLRFQLSRVRGELRVEWDSPMPKVVDYLDGGNVLEK